MNLKKQHIYGMLAAQTRRILIAYGGSFVLFIFCLHHPSIAQDKIKLAVENEPGNLKLHENYIRSVKWDTSELIRQYDLWMNRYPAHSEIPFAIGKTMISKGSPAAYRYLEKAVSINPALSEVWVLLARDAMLRGDDTASAKFLEKGMKKNQLDLDYAIQYADAVSRIDKGKGDSLYLEIAWRFPQSERGALALSKLALNAEHSEDKKAYFHLLHEKYLRYRSDNTKKALNGVFENAMAWYFDWLIQEDPARALELAFGMMVDIKEGRHRWRHRLDVVQALLKGERLLKENKYDEALLALRKISTKSAYYDNVVPIDEKLELLKARAIEASGQLQSAYDSLCVGYCKGPTARLRETLSAYGQKLGKDSVAVHSDLVNILKLRAIPATPFVLEEYGTNEGISLEKYKGKVVLLTYWFPGCSPCRAEFPFFESCFRKFKGSDVAYLAINVERSQDNLVLPFLKNKGYSFVPLKEQENRDKGTLSAISYPTNYLIDKEGRIVYKNFRIDQSNQRMLELMISSLL